jgi:methylated-DNA-[protein]-cysteine S-methyltransferase
MTSYSILNTPQGDLMLVANASELIGIYFNDCDHVPKALSGWKLDPQHPILRQAKEQLEDYFEGKRTSFSIPLHFAGTDFQQRVWREIARIPYGQTLTYSDLAHKAGNPQAIRAAGTNTGRNPLAIIIPCHRVLAKGGGLGGFAGGLDWKRYLLGLEKIHVAEGDK